MSTHNSRSITFVAKRAENIAGIVDMFLAEVYLGQRQLQTETRVGILAFLNVSLVENKFTSTC